MVKLNNLQKEGVKMIQEEEFTAIRKANIPFGAKLLAVDIANMSMYSFSNDEIAERIGAGRSSVARWINDLKDAELITSYYFKRKRVLTF